MAIRIPTPDGATAGPATTPSSGRRRTMFVALAAVGAIGVLAGCGGGSSLTGATTEGTQQTAAASTNPGSGSSSKAPYTDAEACAWLKENLPKVPDTAVGAQAQLAIGLSAFFEDHGGLAGADGYALDDALTRGCPDRHEAALKKAGIESFGNL